MSLTPDQQFFGLTSHNGGRKYTNDVTDSREQDQPTPTASYLPRERTHVLDDQAQAHLAPEVYWPQHVTMDVIELSDGSSTLSAICNQHGLRTGECFISEKGSCS